MIFKNKIPESEYVYDVLRHSKDRHNPNTGLSPRFSDFFQGTLKIRLDIPEYKQTCDDLTYLNTGISRIFFHFFPEYNQTYDDLS